MTPPHPAAADAQALGRAWELQYLDPAAATALGRRLAQEGGPLAPDGWLQLALVEARAGDAAQARQALQHARAGFAARGDTVGGALADEVQAILLRRDGDYAGAARLQAEIDQRVAAAGLAPTPMHRFLACNQRGATAKLLGHTEQALRHFHAAVEAAEETGWIGPRLTALCNLGGYHNVLFNHHDAQVLTERAWHEARAADVRPVIGITSANLVGIRYARGDRAGARAMVDFLVGHAEWMPGSLQRFALTLALGHLGVGEIDAAERYLEAGAVTAIADGDGMTLWGWLRTRCLLERGQPAAARELAERILAERGQRLASEQPYELMELHRGLAEACEQLQDWRAALACARQAQALYEQLVGAGTRARLVALQVGLQVEHTQRERDRALVLQRSAEDANRRLAELNAALQAQVTETERLAAQLREQALRDPLTGLHNRRYLFESAPALLQLAQRHGETLALVMMDLDHFKRVNDAHGHDAGDAVLRRFAALLLQTLRRSDLVVRYGGEEFVALIPQTGAAGANLLLARLQAAFQAPPADDGGLPGGSFSAGVALFPQHGQTLEPLLTCADGALYAAKAGGRSRIEHAATPPRAGSSRRRSGR